VALDPVTAGISLLGDVINKVWPDKSEQEKTQMLAALSLVQGQMEINKAEAASSNPFTSGWRPFIGWICGAAFGIQFVFGPLAVWVSRLYGHPVDFPAMDMGEMMPVLLGMLGLGGLRTFEKVKGAA
jgi:hypothetical protein